MNSLENKNAGYIKTHLKLRKAFIEIGKRKHFSQITVTELCKEANINRATFYNHYRGCWEIRDEIVEQMIGLIDTLHARAKGTFVIENAKELFDFVNK